MAERSYAEDQRRRAQPFWRLEANAAGQGDWADGADENARLMEALHRTGVIDEDERDELLGRVDGRGSAAPKTLGQC